MTISAKQKGAHKQGRLLLDMFGFLLFVLFDLTALQASHIADHFTLHDRCQEVQS